MYSGVTVEYVGMDIPVKFCDSMSNGSRDIRGADFTSNEHDRGLTQIQVVKITNYGSIRLI